MSVNVNNVEYDQNDKRYDVQEICDMRHLYDMPCHFCVYTNTPNCPHPNGSSKNKELSSWQRRKLAGYVRPHKPGGGVNENMKRFNGNSKRK